MPMTMRVAFQASELSDMALRRFGWIARCFVAHDGSPVGSRALASALELEAARGRPCNYLRRAVAALFDQHLEIAEAEADAANVFEKVGPSAAKFAPAREVTRLPDDSKTTLPGANNWMLLFFCLVTV
jgi:hypothetical protein